MKLRRRCARAWGVKRDGRRTVRSGGPTAVASSNVFFFFFLCHRLLRGQRSRSVSSPWPTIHVPNDRGSRRPIVRTRVRHGATTTGLFENGSNARVLPLYLPWSYVIQDVPRGIVSRYNPPDRTVHNAIDSNVPPVNDLKKINFILNIFNEIERNRVLTFQLVVFTDFIIFSIFLHFRKIRCIRIACQVIIGHWNIWMAYRLSPRSDLIVCLGNYTYTGINFYIKKKYFFCIVLNTCTLTLCSE